MAKRRASEADQVGWWQDQIAMAEKVYKRWSDRFRPDTLWEWYEGFQGDDAYASGNFNDDRYIINLVDPTIDVKIPSIYFFRPIGKVIPKRPREDDELTTVGERAKLREDILSTYVTDPDVDFKDTTGHAVLESFFYYGVCQVGFTADYVENPNADRPIIGPDNNPLKDPESGKPLLQPKMIPNPDNPNPESLYVKHIPAHTFRVSANAGRRLRDCDWAGYYEWHYISDLRQNPKYHISPDLKATGKLKPEEGGEPGEVESTTTTGPDSPQSRRGMVRVWFIWDFRAKEHFNVIDGAKTYLLKPEPYPVPLGGFSDIRWKMRRTGWYPRPPAFTWMSMQAEYNDIRNARKRHRRRFNRRYQAVKDMVEEQEKTKLIEGEDGCLIETLPGGEVRPIEDAPLDASLMRHEEATKEDFMNATAVGGDQRSVPDSETATAAAIGQRNLNVRNSYSQDRVADFLGRTLYNMMQTIEKLVPLPIWIERTSDPLSPLFPVEAQKTAATWEEITSEMLGELNYDVHVDVDQLSPINEATERQDWMGALQLLAQGPITAGLASSDVLLRKTFGMFNIRSAKDLAELKKAMSVVLLTQLPPELVQLLQQMSGVPGPPLASGNGAGANPLAPPAGVEGSPGDNIGPGPAPVTTNPQLSAQMGPTAVE